MVFDVSGLFTPEPIHETRYEPFDFEIFTQMVSDAYSTETCKTYTLDEMLMVFRYFFAKYEEYIGNHPPVREEQLRRLMDVMPCPTDYTGGCDVIDPEEYPAIIDEYFESDFKNCNYRINHFFSGKIRLITRKKVERKKI